MRNWPSIDIMKLYSKTTHAQWCTFLAVCQNNEDVNQLEKTFYGLHAGMTDLVKAKLNTDKITVLFLRWTKSIEMTVKNIYRKKYPSVLDNPTDAAALKISNPDLYKKMHGMKVKRDTEYERFLTRIRF